MQYQNTWELGAPIDTVLYEHVHYQLYTIKDFFMEIHYSATDNKVVGKLPFKSGEGLENTSLSFLQPIVFES